jgi:predicted secreted protein
MHKVKPSIRTINEAFDFDLRGITVITLKNKSTGFEWRYSFGEGFDILREGETVSYEAGANTVFAKGTRVYLEPIAVAGLPSTGDFKELVLAYNRLTEQSSGWADLTGE